MINTKELRRLTQAATPGPWKMVPVGDGRKKCAVANSEFLSILTVTDEGDATFGTVYDDADAEFIAAANPAAISELLDRLEAAEKDLIVKEEVIDSLAAVVKKLDAQCDAAEKERGTLRAKIEQMEKQRPVASIYIDGKGEREFDDWKCDLPTGRSLLYALPGAQAQIAPSVPDGWKLVPIEPTTDMICEMERQWMCGSQIDMAKREWKAACAAAPEAKP